MKRKRKPVRVWSWMDGNGRPIYYRQVAGKKLEVFWVKAWTVSTFDSEVFWVKAWTVSTFDCVGISAIELHGPERARVLRLGRKVRK